MMDATTTSRQLLNAIWNSAQTLAVERRGDGTILFADFANAIDGRIRPPTPQFASDAQLRAYVRRACAEKGYVSDLMSLRFYHRARAVRGKA